MKGGSVVMSRRGGREERVRWVGVGWVWTRPRGGLETAKQSLLGVCGTFPSRGSGPEFMPELSSPLSRSLL